jgi:NAD-dependent dihydropyrimidine dehydrogenase PreA subunit
MAPSLPSLLGTKTPRVDVCGGLYPSARATDDGRLTFDEVPQLYIDPTECIDCGACVPVCPVTALSRWMISRRSGKVHWTNKNYVDLCKFQPDKYQKASS